MKLLESKTFLNLAKSYAGECQAHIRYKFIEYGARYNNYKNIASIIDDLVYNEFNHARMFYTFIQDATKDTIANIDISSGYPFKEKWDLMENLRLASEDEKNEGTKIYPQYAEIARQEGFEEIATLFENIAKIERDHSSILADLYNQIKKETLYKKPNSVAWKCADCGYIAEGKEPWQTCPVCKAERESIILKCDASSSTKQK
ncbi:MAG: ferritin family protein [Clostridia bacterium]|nr:ferritin family protein [Clostridia bacterium]